MRVATDNHLHARADQQLFPLRFSILANPPLKAIPNRPPVGRDLSLPHQRNVQKSNFVFCAFKLLALDRLFQPRPLPRAVLRKRIKPAINRLIVGLVFAGIHDDGGERPSAEAIKIFSIRPADVLRQHAREFSAHIVIAAA